MNRAAEEAGRIADEIIEQGGVAPEVEETVDETPAYDQVVDTQVTGVGEEEDYKHKYDTLEGMFRTEVPKLQAQISFLQGMLADQANKKEDVQAQDVQVDASKIDYLKNEYPEVFESANALIASAEQRIMSKVELMIGQLAVKANATEQKVTQSSEVIFWDTLKNLVPDWQTWNNNQKFLSWLNQADEFSGIQKLQLLQRAQNAFDAQKVAKFFNAFKKENGIEVSSPKSRDREVAPGRSTGSVGSTKTVSGDTDLSMAEVSKFYDDVRRGLYRGKEKEQKAMDDRINAMAMRRSQKR